MCQLSNLVPTPEKFSNVGASYPEVYFPGVGCQDFADLARTCSGDKFVVSRTVEAYDAAETGGQDTIVEGRPRLDEFKESTMLDLGTQLRSAAAAALVIMIAFGAS